MGLTGEQREQPTEVPVAETIAGAVPPLVQTFPGMDVPDAYEIQLLGVRRRLAAGRTVYGHKVGNGECVLDQLSLTMGYAGVYSSFLKHADRLSDRYDVSGADLLIRADQRKLVGGQEDQLVDIAFEIVGER